MTNALATAPSNQTAPAKPSRGIKDLRGKVALVTGAARGIGAATALALADAGAHLILCDLDEQELEQVADQVAERSTCLLARGVDVGDREAMRAFAAEVHELVPCLDVLVNNAGIALQASLLETPLEEWDRLLSVNLYGVIHGCNLFLPAMVARGQGGHVVNVASVVGYSGMPGLNGYVTSKFAVVGLTESLRAEMAPHGIGVSTICPGNVDSGMIDRVKFIAGPAPEARQARSGDLIARYGCRPEHVARAILKAIRRNKAVVPVNPEAWILYFLKRLSPALQAFVLKVTHDAIAKEDRRA